MELTSDVLLAAYRQGYFPMAENREDDQLYWFHPEQRGVLPLDSFHVPKSLAKLARKAPYTITTDTVFPDVIRACAEPHPFRPETWINDAIIALYCELWEQGHAHSVECWQGGTLAGGLYGVAIGGAFFGESMFSRQTGASKLALVHLVQLLKGAGYQLLDTQYINQHLKQFGVLEIARGDYLEQLEKAIRVAPQPCFTRDPPR